MIINGEEPNDIDVKLRSQHSKPAPVATKLVSFAKELGVNVILEEGKVLRVKGAANTVTFHCPGWSRKLEIDLVRPKVTKYLPYIDCDVGNICLRPAGHLDLLHSKTDTGRVLVTLETSILRCQTLQFEPYYDPNLNMAKDRIKKYQNRGWTMLKQTQPWWSAASIS